MSSKLTVGRFVTAVVEPRLNNGFDVAPALITSLKTDEDGKETGRVNLRVFLDTGADLRLSNVYVFDKQPSSDDLEKAELSGTDRVAFSSARG